MAKQLLIVDDIDGSPDARTIEFSLEKDRYEIDLSQINVDKLREALAPFIEKARKTSKRAPNSGRDLSKEEAKTIRKWAVENGYTVSTRGVIRHDVVEAYFAR